jgi:hypothetical protein
MKRNHGRTNGNRCCTKRDRDCSRWNDGRTKRNRGRTTRGRRRTNGNRGQTKRNCRSWGPVRGRRMSRQRAYRASGGHGGGRPRVAAALARLLRGGDGGRIVVAGLVRGDRVRAAARQPRRGTVCRLRTPGARPVGGVELVADGRGARAVRAGDLGSPVRPRPRARACRHEEPHDDTQRNPKAHVARHTTRYGAHRGGVSAPPP